VEIDGKKGEMRLKQIKSLVWFLIAFCFLSWGFLAVPVDSSSRDIETPEAFVEHFIKLPMVEDLDELRAYLAPGFVYRDERSSLEEYHFEFDADTYILGVRSDWESLDTLDVKVVRIRLNESQAKDGIASVSAYYDVWLRDDFGIMGPLRTVYHFELTRAGNSWLVTRLTWAM
jgi:hypothetical protein